MPTILALLPWAFSRYKNNMKQFLEQRRKYVWKINTKTQCATLLRLLDVSLLSSRLRGGVLGGCHKTTDDGLFHSYRS